MLTNGKKQSKIEKQTEVRKIKNISVQQWLPLEEILNTGIIKVNKNKYVKILKIIPINYNLKSDLEKKTILNSYKILLKTCNFNIQILIQSTKEDLEKNIENINKNILRKENCYLKEISKKYIEYINNLNSSKRSSTKNFYIIISKKEKEENFIESFEIIKSDLKEKYFKIKDCLSRCGNSVIEIDNKEEIIKILDSFFNTRKCIEVESKRGDKNIK